MGPVILNPYNLNLTTPSGVETLAVSHAHVHSASHAPRMPSAFPCALRRVTFPNCALTCLHTHVACVCTHVLAYPCVCVCACVCGGGGGHDADL